MLAQSQSSLGRSIAMKSGLKASIKGKTRIYQEVRSSCKWQDLKHFFLNHCLIFWSILKCEKCAKRLWKTCEHHQKLGGKIQMMVWLKFLQNRRSGVTHCALPFLWSMCVMDAIFRIQYWQAEGKGTFLELLKGRYCLFCILDVIKDSASALWKAVAMGNEMMGLSKDMGLD